MISKENLMHEMSMPCLRPGTRSSLVWEREYVYVARDIHVPARDDINKKEPD